MPVQLYKNEKKLYHHISEDVKLKNKTNEKYSIFGHHANAMDFAYVPISNVERNNKGLYALSYKEPSYYREGISSIEHTSKSAPVWLLPFINHRATKEEESRIEPLNTPTEKNTNQPVIHDQAEQEVEQLGIAQKVEFINHRYEKTFTWPYGGTHVVLTGDFDDWKESIEMSPVTSADGSTTHTATVYNLDPAKDYEYKFIVDGHWYFDMQAETIKDDAGNVNNIIYARK